MTIEINNVGAVNLRGVETREGIYLSKYGT